MSGQARFTKGSHDISDELAAFRFFDGDVDRDRKVVQPRVEHGPAHGLAAGFADHPAIELAHEPGLAGGRDELVWAEKSVNRVHPAHQGLHAGEGTRPDIELGEKEETEL